MWTIGTLANGDSAILTLEGTVDVGQGGNTIANLTTAAAGDELDPSTAGDDLEEEVTVDESADLVTTKTLASGDNSPNEGDTVTFSIAVSNNGAALATNVSLTDLAATGHDSDRQQRLCDSGQLRFDDWIVDNRFHSRRRHRRDDS